MSDAARPGAALLIVDKLAAAAVDWRRIADGLPADAAVHLLAFDQPAPPDLAGQFVGRTVEELPAATLLQDELAPFAARVRQWLAPLAAAAAGIEGWQATRLFEWNFAHAEWGAWLRLACLERQLAAGAYRHVAIVAADPFAAAAAEVARRHAGSVSVARQGAAPGTTATRAWLRRLWDALAEARALVAARALPPPPPLAAMVYATYPVNWSSQDGASVYRYAGRYLPELTPGLGFLVSTTRMQIRRLRPPADTARALAELPPADLAGRVVAVERHGSFADLLCCYLSPLASLRYLRAVRRAAGPVMGLPAGMLFDTSFLQSAINDLARSRYFARAAARAMRAAGARAVMVPTYELAEGRAVMLGARRAGLGVVAQQHGHQHALHLWRAADSLAAIAQASGDRSAVPDVLLAESELDRRLFEASGLGCPVEVVGALRVDGAALPERTGQVAADCVLVLGELHGPEALPLACLRMLAGSGRRVVLRPHPLTIERVKAAVAAQVPEAPVEWSDSRRPLADELARIRPLAVLACNTGASVDVALAGWPVCIVAAGDVSLVAPLARGGAVVARHGDELLSWLANIATLPAERAREGERCREAAHRLIPFSGRDAAKRCRPILEQLTNRGTTTP